MGKYTQANRTLALTTPLGPDALLLENLTGSEAISELFRFQLDLLAEKGTAVPFEKVLGQKVLVELRLRKGEKTRYVHGIVNRFSQGHRVRGTESDLFTRYFAEVVPECWLLTKNVRSRIFQSMAVPDILYQVLNDEWKLNVSFASIQGNYYPRDYCVQYRESDFAFVSRLMEEEGIYYYFVHSADGHQMVLGDVPQGHPPIDEVDAVKFDEEDRHCPGKTGCSIKTQEIRSGKVTLWDHCFELPQANLEAKSTVVGQTVTTGDVDHSLQAGGNQRLEIYDFPGGYAQRFDGVNPAGADRPDDLTQIFQDNRRTATIRMQQETVPGLTIAGSSNCWHFVAGHCFNLEDHFDADDTYVLTRVEHNASIAGAYATGKKDTQLVYTNQFQCMPFDPALPFRPQRVTPKPKIEGVQTAVVTGLSDDRGNYFTDKYGRVKVQFFWDREGTLDADSSCWLRVAQIWAGKSWGAFFWPRPGHEVVVAFEEGDPDRPLIIGSVYNAENMPPVDPVRRPMVSGIKSCTVRKTADKYFNGIIFVDEAGDEHLAIHSERTMVFNAEYNKIFRVGQYHDEIVPGTRMHTVGGLPGLGGGGSGGGGDAQASSTPGVYTDPIPSVGPFGGGIGSQIQMVFGQNIAGTLGLLNNVTLGGSNTLVIDPLSLATAVKGGKLGWLSSAAIQALTGALGGNVNFTMGPNAHVTLGNTIHLNVMADIIHLSGKDKATEVMMVIAGTVSALWTLIYALDSMFAQDPESNYNARVDITAVTEAILGVLFPVILAWQMFLKMGNAVEREGWKKLFVARGLQTAQEKEDHEAKAQAAKDAAKARADKAKRAEEKVREIDGKRKKVAELRASAKARRERAIFFGKRADETRDPEEAEDLKSNAIYENGKAFKEDMDANELENELDKLGPQRPAAEKAAQAKDQAEIDQALADWEE